MRLLPEEGDGYWANKSYRCRAHVLLAKPADVATSTGSAMPLPCGLLCPQPSYLRIKTINMRRLMADVNLALTGCQEHFYIYLSI